MYLDRVEDPDKNKIIQNYRKRIYPILAYRLDPGIDYREDYTENFIENLFNVLYFNFDYNFMDKNKYHKLLWEIGEVGWDWINNKTVSNNFIEKLNKLFSNIKDRSFPFNDFCYKFFDDLLDELKDNQKITQCSFCGNIFPFHKTRKYCSMKTENKDCGKKARNRRSYLNRREIILPKAKKTAKKLRKWYKDRGVNR